MVTTKQITETIIVAFIAVASMLFVGLGTASAAIDLGDVTVTNVNTASVSNHVTATSNTGANLVLGGNGGYGGNAGSGGSFAGNGGNGGSGDEGGNGGNGGNSGGSLFSLNSNNWWDCGCSDYSTDSVAGNGGDAGNGGHGAVGGNGGDTGNGGNGAAGGNGGTGGVITTGNASTVTAVSNDVNSTDTKIETSNCDCFAGLFDLWSKDVWSSDDSLSTNHFAKDKSTESYSGSSYCDCDQWGNSYDSSDLSIVKDSSDAKSSESGSSEMSKTHVPINFGDITVTNVNAASVGNDVNADSNTGKNTALGGNGENGGTGGSGGSFAGNGGNGGSGDEGGNGGNGGDASLAYLSTGGDGGAGGNGGHGADAGFGGSTGDGGNGAEAGNGGNGGVIHTGESMTATAIVNVVNSTISRITRN